MIFGKMDEPSRMEGTRGIEIANWRPAGPTVPKTEPDPPTITEVLHPHRSRLARVETGSSPDSDDEYAGRSRTFTEHSLHETLEADSRSLTQSRSASFNWNFGFWIAIFHLGAIAAFFFFSWSALAVTAVLWVLGQNVGIGMSYHRLLTHRGYTTPKWVEYVMAVCGTLALQGGPIYWVAVHRLHHQLTDRPGDPHSPRDGKWWSHTGWILHGTAAQPQSRCSRATPPTLPATASTSG